MPKVRWKDVGDLMSTSARRYDDGNRVCDVETSARPRWLRENRLTSPKLLPPPLNPVELLDGPPSLTIGAYVSCEAAAAASAFAARIARDARIEWWKRTPLILEM